MATDEGAKHSAAVTSGKLDLKKKSRELKQQIVSVNQHEFRELFGVRSADKWGSFVDCNLSAIFHSYADWAGYPRGKHTVLEGREGTGAKRAAVSSDGYHLFAAMKDGTITVWDLTENCEIGAWKAHEGYVKCLDYHCSGVLVSGGADNLIRIWDGHTAALIRTLEGHTDWIDTVAFTDDADRVVSGSYDNSIRLWSIETGECLRQFLGHLEAVTKVRWIGDVIISISDDGYLKLWRLSESEASMSIGNEDDSMDDFSVNCDHSLVVLIHENEPSVYWWPQMKMIRSIDEIALNSCFHPLIPHLMALNTLNENFMEEIQIYDVRNGECVLNLGNGSGLSDFCFSPDGSRLIGVIRKNIHIWDVCSL